MNQTASAYEQLIERFVAWAQERPDIRLAMVLGSRARTETPADEWSDLDMVLMVTDPGLYLNSTDWLKNLGDFQITFLEPTATGDGMERRVLFNGGLDADFAIVSCRQTEQEIQRSSPSEIMQIFGRGIRVLIDKDGRIPPLPPSFEKPGESNLPTQSEFAEIASDFWYHTVWTAKKLRRGEFWTAMMCCDFYMKRLLLRVVEYHAQVLNGGHYDTWFNGRFLERWADPRVLEGLRHTFAHYSEEDIRRALLATMDLFRWVTKEIAERLNYPYPVQSDEYATELVSKILSGLTE
jgi:aminoglycoside 6-adenylyltransferase